MIGSALVPFSPEGVRVKNYVITYYVPNEHDELVFLAKAIASGNDAQEAALEAFKALEPSYPAIIKGYWLGTKHHGSAASETP